MSLFQNFAAGAAKKKTAYKEQLRQREGLQEAGGQNFRTYAPPLRARPCPAFSAADAHQQTRYTTQPLAVYRVLCQLVQVIWEPSKKEHKETCNVNMPAHTPGRLGATIHTI